MSFEEYVDWIGDHAEVTESGHWYIAELDLPDTPKIAEQGNSRQEALENLAKRYQRFREREHSDSTSSAKKVVGPRTPLTD